MKRKFPPPSVWISAAALVTLFIVGSAFVLEEREGYGAFYRNFQSGMQDLEERYEIAEDDEVVIIFGSSFTAMGIQHHPYFYDRFLSETGEQVHVFKIYMYNCSASDLKELPEFFEAAKRLKADIVCIEERLLAFDEYKSGMLHLPRWLQRYSLRVEGLKEHLLASLGKEDTENPGTFEFFWKYHEEANWVDSTTFGTSAFELRSFAENDHVNQRLAEFQADGVQLVMLNLPRPAVTTRVLKSIKEKQAFQVLLKRYREEFGMQQWEYPEILPYSHFTDAHLNRLGMERYSDWLFQQIKANR